ncbi:MAG: branched-chain amino acid ABC transporter permease, partial [Bdellovibrio sp.]
MKSWKAPILSWIALIGLGILAQEWLDSFLQYQLSFILINITLALSLNLVNGITGQFSLGHAGFMAVGAYISAFGLTHLHSEPNLGHFFLWACLGGLGASLAGFIVGLPSLRLRGDYLAVVTLGFGEIIRVLALNIEAIGGARGLPDIPAPPPLHLGSWQLSSFLQQFLHSGFWTLVCFFTCWRLVQSGVGRGFLSVREDELAAESCGVPTTRAKIQSFMLGSGFAGVAGAC